MLLPTPSLADRIRAALAEDLGSEGDVTSAAVFGADHRSRAVVVAKADGVLCGVDAFRTVFEVLDSRVRVEHLVADGTPVVRGMRVLALQGPTVSLLSGERTALNFLQRLGGIATLTARFVAAAGGRVLVCDTRKTTPLWRDLEKYAVACGGGTNHRMA